MEVKKLVWMSEGETYKLPKGVESYGDYNKLPTPHYEVPQDEYIFVRNAIDPRYIEHRQVELDGKFRRAVIEWYHDRGYVIFFPLKWRCGKQGEPSVVYEEPIRYFRVGCDHEFKELSFDECRKLGITHHGNCWHVRRCSKCGTTHSYDSSD